MPSVNDINSRSPLDDFSQNRREFYAPPEETIVQGNRIQVIAPDIQDTTVQANQVVANQTIPINSINVADIGNAGISNVGNAGSDIRLWAGATFINRFSAPFRVDQDGNLIATSATISGAITASTGSIGGFVIGADYIRDAANSMGLASTVTGGDDVRFWAGSSYASRASAPFRVLESGALFASSVTVTGTINATGGYIGSTTALVYESQGIATGVTGYIRGNQTDYNTGTGYFLGYSGGTYKLSIGDGGVSQYLTWDGTNLVVNGRAFIADPSFGDGSDGNVTIGVGTTTLTRDMFYNILIVNGTLNAGGYRIFAKTSITVNNGGSILRTGNTGNIGTSGNPGTSGGGGGNGGTAGTAGAGVTGLASGSLYGGLAGIAASASGAGGNQGSVGSAGTINNAGANQSTALGANGSIGVAGVMGGQGNLLNGGVGGAISAAVGIATAPISSVRNLGNALLMIDSGAAVVTQYRGGASGSSSSGSGGGGGGSVSGTGALGGGGGGAGGSGGGGGTGGVSLIASRSITVNTGGTISVKGGSGGAGQNGGDGGAGQNGGGGIGGGGGGGGAGGTGGSGGSGGIMVLVYTMYVNSGTVTVAGGDGGVGGLGGAAGAGGSGTIAGGNGSIGTTGAIGATGSAGLLVQLQLS